MNKRFLFVQQNLRIINNIIIAESRFARFQTRKCFTAAPGEAFQR